MSSVAAIVAELKNNGQDFEFYPTTREIIEAMYWDLNGPKKGEEEYRVRAKSFSVLDIGAGSCKLLNTFQQIAEEQPLLKEYQDERSCPRDMDERCANRIFFSPYMAIEKSQILLDRMPANAMIVGTDFWENTLIDKKTDIIFCNPPYGEFARWSARIIREANARFIYLVIPQRWGKNGDIAQALKLRKAHVKIIGNFDFLESEDRNARDSSLRYFSEENTMSSIDPFDVWFNETFKLQAEKEFDKYDNAWKQEKREKENLRNALVNAHDLVTTLVELYNNEMDKLIKNYLAVAELDAEIFKELNVDVKTVKESLRLKIKNLKALYWQEIFSNMTEITTRLTSKTRASLLETLTANTHIDFTAGNIRSVVIWVIKNANKYFDSQMLDVYDDFTSEEGFKLYKSNAHWQKDTWRYARVERDLKEQGVKYALDYRIILDGPSSYDKWNRYKLPPAHVTKIEDIIVIAKNLGFSIDESSVHFGLAAGEKSEITFNVPKDRKLNKGQKTNCGKIEDVCYIEEDVCYQYLIDGEWTYYSHVKIDSDIFTTFKGFKNGNLHFQFNQEFIKKFNLEVGRLRGWIKSPQEATEEMDISIEEATKYWKSNFTLLPSHVPNLLPNVESKKEDDVAEQKEEKLHKTDESKSLFDFDVA